MSKSTYLLSCLFFAVVCTGFAQPGNTGSTNNAATRSKVIATFRAQLGVRELTGHNDGKEVAAYLKYCGLTIGNPWCAAAMCWGLGQNGVPNPRSGYCPDLFAAKNVIYRVNAKNNLTPLPGDIYGIYFPEKKRIAHVGAVEVWGAKITTGLEGNTNLAGSREGDGFYRKIRLTRQLYAVTRFIK